MYRPEQGSHVQDTIAAFSRLMVDSDVSHKSSVMLPSLTINTPAITTSVSDQPSSLPSLSPSSERSNTSASSEACSPATQWTNLLSSPSSSPTASSVTGIAAGEQPPFLISQPIMPMSVIPAAIMRIKSTPPCVSLGAVNGPTAASVSLLPLVGRDYMNYSSLNATLTTGKVSAESTPRPLSSMEYAESWLPTLISTTDTAAEAVEEKSCASSSMLTSRGSVEDTYASCINDTDQPGGTKTVMRISTDCQSIHPLQLDPNHDTNNFQEQDHSFKELSSASIPLKHGSQKDLQQPVVRKKTSFAARIRNVFISKQSLSKSIETQEDIISLSSSSEDDKSMAHNANSRIGNQHRGSVSSTSSVDTALGHGELRRDSVQAVTPLTSPENSPLNSPTIKSTPTLIAGSSNHSLESLSGCPFLARDVECATERVSDATLPKSQTAIAPINQSAIQPIPTRTVKKRLSFASISSFFGAHNPQERRTKQQRSSSLPYVENPLVAVGRQIAGFQRRHSLNDLHDGGAKSKNKSSPHHPATPPWKNDRTAPHTITPASVPASTSTQTVVSPNPTKKLSLNSVFTRQLKKKKNASRPAQPTLAKPLKSALVHRSPANTPPRVHHVHNTRRRSASMRSQSSSQRRHQQHRFSQNYSQRQSQQSLTPNDPFARLAEANQALASLNHHQSRKSPPPSSVETDYCLSPQAYETPEDQLPAPTRPQGNNANGALVSCTLSTPPTPRVLPVITKNATTVLKVRSDLTCSPPPNPLASLSRSSSCCSFSSSSEDVNASRSSFVSDDGDSCSSSTYSSQFEVNATSFSSSYSQPPNDQTTVYRNSLLPTSAARVSVDRIAVEAQMKQTEGVHMDGQREDTYESQSTSMTTGNSSTYESSSTVSSSTATSSTSSPGTSGHRNIIYNSQYGYIHQQSNYQHLKHQPQFMALEQQPYEQEYYTEDHRNQEEGLLVNTEPQQDYQYQQCYYEDSSLYPPRPSRRLQFSLEKTIVHSTWTPEQYDRTSDPDITASRLTPTIAQKIKLELNQFKGQEMEVHQDSRVYTHFFI
ncbi:hypothetical protein BGX27_002920 [Mortierella sp. AM989]|nr:hypothetical protein BGX27_002920 [Mortierella sp. AM989]